MRIERVRRDGPLGDARWRRLAEHIGLTRDDRTLALRYDQRLALPCRRGLIVDIDRWPVGDQIEIVRNWLQA